MERLFDAKSQQTKDDYNREVGKFIVWHMHFYIMHHACVPNCVFFAAMGG